MAGTTPIYGLPYPQSSDLVSAYPALGQDLATDLDGILAAKADYPSGGSNGNVLTKSGTSTAWASAPAAGYTLIGSPSTLSAAGSLILNSVFNSTYDNYYAVLDYTSSNASHYLTLKLRSSGTDASTNYKHQRLYGTTSAAAAQNTTASSFECAYGDNVRNVVTFGLYGPALARATVLESRTAGFSGAMLNLYGGLHTDATAYDGMTLAINSGTITGTFWLFGLRKS